MGKNNSVQSEIQMNKKEQNQAYFEPDLSDGKPGVDVNNLQKVFKSLTGEPIKAVNSVSFKAYEGQITALLGHNGAGKSTTMNVLTGMLSASGGSAVINGYSIGNFVLTVTR